MNAVKLFETFLTGRLSLDDDLLGSSDWAGTGNTIGALALRLGLLDLPEIDKILDMQEDDKRLFGEIAAHLGFLTNDQVERLVELQQFHQLFELGERQVAAGRVSIAELLRLILEFQAAIELAPTQANG